MDLKFKSNQHKKELIHIITGHRGTGKTHWLKIISHLYKNQSVLCFDLDKEVESLSGQSIGELFQKGEEVFRAWEKKVFLKILYGLPEDKKIFISVGAGFRFKRQPHWKVIHLGRASDSQGRIFLNSRPRLKPKENPYKEYKLYYSKREARYRRQADEVFIRREHFNEAHISDKLFLGLKQLKNPLFSLTLSPHLLPANKKLLQEFLKKRLNWGIRFFELNDRTASLDFVSQIRDYLPNKKLLFTSQKTEAYRAVKGKLNWCWDLSLGSPPRGVDILSFHNRGGRSLKSVIRDISQYQGLHLKLAPLVYNLQELWEGFCWQREDWENRSFLPRSLDGRWKWYRMAFGPKTKLYFIKERGAVVKDQPFFSEAVHFTGKPKGLAGVMGYPVEFSASPKEHNDFFLKKRIPFFPVPIKEEEVTGKNLEILKNLGFVFFAVTSPLKRRAFQCLKNPSEKLKRLESLNTLILHKGEWRGYNTDIKGLSILQKQTIGKKTVIWGGGGIRPPLRELLSEASFYSARKGKPLYGKSLMDVEVLIWAVGRSAVKRGARFPPQKWKPSLILDINYSEDSPGLEYAIKTGAEYKNGWDIFKMQAKKQRSLFARLENQR